MKNKTIGYIRSQMQKVAELLNKLTSGKLKPNHITIISLLGHIPVLLALIYDRPILAAGLLAFFASLDALDGALAKVQGSQSLSGMYYDATSDRAKEILVFSGLAIFMSGRFDLDLAWLVVATAGTSLLVSYTKAKGEMALSQKNLNPQKLNRVYSIGLASYETRTILLLFGLVFALLPQILIVLLSANIYTCICRVVKISKELKKLEKSTK